MPNQPHPATGKEEKILRCLNTESRPSSGAGRHKVRLRESCLFPALIDRNQMKAILTRLMALALLGSVVSCASGPNASTGTVLGGLGGAALGGIVGHQSGRGLEGAAIGGVLGAAGGNMIGGAQDQQNAGYYGNGAYRRQPAPPQYYDNRPAPRYNGY
jgi:Glycine zipper